MELLCNWVRSLGFLQAQSAHHNVKLLQDQPLLLLPPRKVLYRDADEPAREGRSEGEREV